MSLSKSRKLAGRRPAHARLRLLPLEHRIVPSTLSVDDDRVQYPAAGYTSIQSAVDSAEPGDTVRVYPGLYNEVVTVAKRLTLVGSGPDAAPPAPYPGPGRTRPTPRHPRLAARALSTSWTVISS